MVRHRSSLRQREHNSLGYFHPILPTPISVRRRILSDQIREAVSLGPDDFAAGPAGLRCPGGNMSSIQL